MRHLRPTLVMAMIGFVISCSPASTPVSVGPAEAAPSLDSWSAGPAREAIVSFVARVTDPSSPDFVPEDERIATFDNDGTLWAEQPLYFQILFAADRLVAMAGTDEALAAEEPYRSLLAEGPAALAHLDTAQLLGSLAAAHAGMTESEFRATASEWLASARHPTLDVPYTELTYAPMVELLEYLRAHGFETWICTGGGVSFVRLFSDDAYGIEPEQVIGSRMKLEFEQTADGPVLHRLAELAHLNDGGGKPVGIATSIGRRPILAFGNSDGDLEMLQYADSGDGPALALLLHHDDAEREWAYDRDSPIGHLERGFDLAAERGWTMVSMRDDWSLVFEAVPPQQ